VTATLLVVAGVITTVAVTSDPSGGAPAGSAPTTTPRATPPQRLGVAFFQDGREVGAYQSLIGSEENWGGTRLTQEGVAAQGPIEAGPSDVDGKGDGRRVSWAGTSEAQYYVQYPGGRQDARAYVDTGVLTFDVIVYHAPAAATTLAMHCSYPCAGQLDATSLFRDLPVGRKSTVRIPIACFTAKGLDPAKVDTPFLVATEGRFEAAFADIGWQADAATGAGVTTCSDLR